MASDEKSSLQSLVLDTIETHFDETRPVKVPSPIVLQLLEYLMKRRKKGSRALNASNIARFFDTEIVELDLSQFWMTDEPFQDFPCTKLVSIDLTECLQVGDGCVRSLAENCPSLQVLTMEMCNQLTDAGCGEIAKMINLKELAIRCLKITDEGITKIAHGCPQLTNLRLTNCKNITPVSLLDFVKFKPNLESLHISYCPSLDDTVIADIGEAGLKNLRTLEIIEGKPPKMRMPDFGKFPALEKLKIAKTCITNIESLSSLSNLTSLKISGAKMTDVSCLRPLAANLRVLQLAQCAQITPGSFQSVLELCANLQKLDVLRSTKLLSTLKAPFPPMPMLSSLNVGFSSNEGLPSHITWQHTFINLCLAGTMISNTDLQIIATQCPLTENLDLQECPKITSTGINHVSALRNLRRLDISKCMRLKDPKLEAPSLTTLYCRYNHNCKSLSFTSPLEVIDISGCEAWDDTFLNSVATSGSRIRHLWMQRNGGISDELLRIISESCPDLQAINLSEVSSITPDALWLLINSCQRLERIYLNACNIDGLEHFIKEVEKKNPFITITKNA